MKKNVYKNSEITENPRKLFVKLQEENTEYTEMPSTDSLIPIEKPHSTMVHEVPSEEQIAPTPIPTQPQPPSMPIDSEESEHLRQEALEEKERILSEVEETKTKLLEEQQKEFQSMRDAFEKEREEKLNLLNSELESIKNQAKEEGFEAGKKEGISQGIEKGHEEVERIVKSLQKAVADIFSERKRVLNETEGEIVDLVLLIANKVVKSITNSYKRVVYDNVAEALKKLQVYSEVVVRVNPEDLFTLTKHRDQLINSIQELDGLKILEDPTVDLGGCIVSSDFGSMDARIASQLNEIEEQIRKISPIKPH